LLLNRKSDIRHSDRLDIRPAGYPDNSLLAPVSGYIN
jgi:hypothetical protein